MQASSSAAATARKSEHERRQDDKCALLGSRWLFAICQQVCGRCDLSLIGTDQGVYETVREPLSLSWCLNSRPGSPMYRAAALSNFLPLSAGLPAPVKTGKSSATNSDSAVCLQESPEYAECTADPVEALTCPPTNSGTGMTVQTVQQCCLLQTVDSW